MGVQKPLTLEIIREQCQNYWEWLAALFRLPVKKLPTDTQRLKSGPGGVLAIPTDEPAVYQGRKGTKPLSGEGLVVNTERVSSGYLTVQEDEITEDDVQDARIQMRKIAQRLVSTLSRNRRRSKVNVQIDYRRSLRRSIQTGGVMIDLKYKTRVIKKPRLVIILDTSGSMQVWIKMLIQLIQAVGLELSKKEIFIFAQDLEHVTKDLGKTWQDTVSVMQLRENWGGTTSIYYALKTLQEDHHDKFSPQTVVLMLSDLFTSEPEKSSLEVRKLYRKTKAFYIFRVVVDEEEDMSYFDTYVRPFIGSATGLFDVKNLEGMAEAVRRVCIR
ncbi:VWA domain containing CoxE-like protein [Pelotomaculum sp. FP]|uniref:VWA domain-containing protein n=1 Tax=Pelotomaculum sp. FP TaxID=261474 RepID=UPI0010651C53|nr:VWA domain-containing protein [Pelotomaculum sp. FP]TEB14739.1 VWA domain containing CoxE-like protein [Pelotomaculum sp. FP]